MKYQSSRGLEKGVSFRDVLFSGYSKDGGLYFPERIPGLTHDQLVAWSQLSYPHLLSEILSLFIHQSELTSSQIKDVASAAFERFDIAEVMRVVELRRGLRISELFHGPTLAFKDLSLSVVGLLIQAFLSAEGGRCLMIVATSGDTGSAAIQAVLGLSQVDIVVLLPHGRCTAIQELQMTTCIADNVHIFSVDGNTDEMDITIKKVFADREFTDRHQVLSSNSINWARVVSQMAHFFYGYFRSCATVGDVVEMVVPTGAAGNITAGCVAARMGLPIRIVVTVNKNDIIHRALSTGDFSIANDVQQSLAPAMDIQTPYNFERLLLLFTNMDTERVASMMSTFESTGRVQLASDVLAAMREIIVGTHVASDVDITTTMARCWTENEYALCPHTATGADYHYRHTDGSPRRLCVATAGPDKFPETLRRAGIERTPCQRIRRLAALPTKSEPMPRSGDWEAMLRAKIEHVTASRHVTPTRETHRQDSVTRHTSC